jgi:hypothetical protein
MMIPGTLFTTRPSIRKRCDLTLIFGYLALALGIAFEIVGLVSLFIAPVLTLVVLGLQSLWIVAAAIMLVLGAGKASNGAVSSQECKGSHRGTVRR